MKPFRKEEVKGVGRAQRITDISFWLALIHAAAFTLYSWLQYHWHGDGEGYFGAYSFYQPAFDQARRSWWLHAEVIEGSNKLWAKDDNIVFDDSMVGYHVRSMNMAFVKNGEVRFVYFEGAKVVKVTDKHEAVLDKVAPHHAEQWGLGILPSDWTDMCACTNNFGPKFENGHPVVEQ